MATKCSNCGASVMDDSRFCNYCGAKIEDNIQHVEVSGKIDQNVTHRFAFNTESRIRKIEAKKELEAEKARQAVLLEQERRKTMEKQQEHARRENKFLLIFFGIALLILLISALSRGN